MQLAVLVTRRMALLLAVSALIVTPSHAQVATYDAAAVFNLVKSYGQQAQSYATQLQQLRLQLSSYANMLQNTVNLPVQVWNQATSDLAAVRNLSNAGSLLSGNTGSMLQRLGQANAYARQAGSILDMGSQLTQWQQTAAQSMSSLGRVLGLQQVQSASDAQLIQQIQIHGQTAQGQVQAIQAGIEMSSVQAGQLARIQETLATTAAMNAAQATVAADRRAVYDASALRLSTGQVDQTPGRVW
jgi:P-type conjugative transfer protein TrbJ